MKYHKMNKIEETTKIASQQQKRTIEDMQDLAKKYGGRCLSETYINSTTKLKWECKNGHVWESTTRGMRRIKFWCPKCKDRV